MTSLFCDGETPKYIFYASDLPSYIYYLFVPSIVITFLLGLFVFLKNKRDNSTRVFFLMTLIMTFWMVSILGNWAQNNPALTIFFDQFNALVSVVPILFVYFILLKYYKINFSFWEKTLLFAPLVPVLIFLPTKQNISMINLGWCETSVGKLYWYVTFVLITYALFALFLIIKKIKNEKDGDIKKQLILVLSGFFIWTILSVFFGFVLSIFGYPQSTLWAPTSCTLFTILITWSIVKYKFLEIKTIATQILVIALIILIGSQFAFIRNNTNKILTAITLTIAVIFGWILVRSVKREVKQREELEIANSEIEKRNKKLSSANKEISKRKEQLQKISDSLAIANDKLKKLDIAKTEFVSMASHQLRTPPTPIKGYSSMLLEGSYGELNEEQRKAVENIFSANNQQIAFVEDLLNVSRIESGGMNFEFKKHQIEDLCQEVINNLALKAKDKNLYLDYKAPAKPLPKITIDGAKIREVISNLVDNAIKYTLKGGITLSTELCIKKQTECLEKTHLRITVSDTGIGIPKDEIPYLFAKFSRGKDITRLNTGGTGLGLYVVKMITTANGGKVWIESPGAGMGTKFILELPLEQLQETIEKNR